MKKVNRNKSLRILLAIISTSLIASASGCIKKEKTFTKNQKQLIEEDIAKMTRLNNMFNLSDEINKYFHDNNIEGEIREKEDIKYINYPTNYIKVNDEYLEISEIEEELSRLDKMSLEGKLEEMAYINASINTCNLLPAYENLYRTILTTATGIDYNTVKEGEKYITHIEEGANLIKNNMGDPIELIMVQYNIDEANARLLVRLIKDKRNLNDLYKKMENDPDFGPEDYIISSKEDLTKIMNTYYSVLFDFCELNDPNYYQNNKTKKKIK